VVLHAVAEASCRNPRASHHPEVTERPRVIFWLLVREMCGGKSVRVHWTWVAMKIYRGGWAAGSYSITAEVSRSETQTETLNS